MMSVSAVSAALIKKKALMKNQQKDLYRTRNQEALHTIVLPNPTWSSNFRLFFETVKAFTFHSISFRFSFVRILSRCASERNKPAPEYWYWAAIKSAFVSVVNEISGLTAETWTRMSVRSWEFCFWFRTLQRKSTEFLVVHKKKSTIALVREAETAANSNDLASVYSITEPNVFRKRKWQWSHIKEEWQLHCWLHYAVESTSGSTQEY